MATPEVENDKLWGMAKRIDKEFNELPVLEHATLITLLNAMMKKRIEAQQRTQIEAQQELQRTAQAEQDQLRREAQFGVRGPVAVVPQ